MELASDCQCESAASLQEKRMAIVMALEILVKKLHSSLIWISGFCCPLFLGSCMCVLLCICMWVCSGVCCCRRHLGVYAWVCTEMLERSFLMISLTSSRYIWSSSWGSCLTVMAIEGGLASSGSRLGELPPAWAEVAAACA